MGKLIRLYALVLVGYLLPLNVNALVLDTSNDSMDGALIGQLTPGNTTQIAGLEYVTTTYGDIVLEEFYKQDVGGGESGSFTGDYTTSFTDGAGNTSTDPENALIEFDNTGNFITGSPLFVFVKDGNNSPYWYLWDITNLWDGQEDISIEGLWTGKGAISHVSIMGIPTTTVSEAGALALFGLGLFGLMVVRRKI